MTTDWAPFIAAMLNHDELNAGNQHELNCRLFRGLGNCTCDAPRSIVEWCRTGRALLDLHSDDPVTLAELAWPYRRHPDHPHHQETA